MQKARKGMTLRIAGREDADFLRLTDMLVSEYVALYGEEALSFCPAGVMAQVVCTAVAYYESEAAASGALRRMDDHTAELIRIYVRPTFRRLGLGERIVSQLEREAKCRGYVRIVLVTGLDMPAALALYGRLGYARTDNYGPMRDDPLCVCMEKQL